MRLFWVHIPVLRCFSPRLEGVGRCIFTITIPVSGPSEAFVHSSRAAKYLAWLGFVFQPQVHLQLSSPMFAEEHVLFRIVVSDHACAILCCAGKFGKFVLQTGNINHKVRHPRCVFLIITRLECIYCRTQLSGGELYNLLHRKQLHVSALIMAIFRLCMKHLVSSYTKHICGLLIWGRDGLN